MKIGTKIDLNTDSLANVWLYLWDGKLKPIPKDTSSGGFKVGGARGKAKKGAPLMTSSYSANRDKHFDQA